MSVIVHPLTAVNDSPSYTADDYRHAVNPLMLPSDGSSFDGVQGVRYGSPSPLSKIDGLTVTIKPHCGTVSPWTGAGVYTYCITSETTVDIADSTNNYKIAVVVEDPSQSHGTVPRGKLQVFSAGTPDLNIPGLVIAKVSAGSVSDAAPMVRNSSVVVVGSVAQLDDIRVADGQEAVVLADDSHHVYADGKWRDSVETIHETWLGGEIDVVYGQSSCLVQVSNVKIGEGSWDHAIWPSVIRREYRPVFELSTPLSVNNGGSVTGLLSVDSDGHVIVKNMGASGSGDSRRGCICWPTRKQW